MGSSGKPGRKEPAAGRKKSSGNGRKSSTSGTGRKTSGKRGKSKVFSLRGKLPSLPLLAVWIVAVAVLGSLIYFSGTGGHLKKRLLADKKAAQRPPVAAPVRETASPAGAGSSTAPATRAATAHREKVSTEASGPTTAGNAPQAQPLQVQPPRANAVHGPQKHPESELPAGPVLAPRPTFSSRDLAPSAPASTTLLALNRPAPTPPPPQPPTGPMLARVAIVIDDIGRDIQAARKFLSLPFPVTLSILPYLRYSTDIAKLAHSKGKGIMLHLPMEPQGYPKTNPGRGALLFSMSGDAIKSTIAADLSTSSYFQGVNNHMGSRLTEDAASMKVVLSELHRRGLFFLDSYTSPGSKALSVAQELRMPCAKRDVFLDNSLSTGSIHSELERLIRLARVNGTAIAIGHPHDATYRALRDAAPTFAKNGIKIVPVSELMVTAGEGASAPPRKEPAVPVSSQGP